MPAAAGFRARAAASRCPPVRRMPGSGIGIDEMSKGVPPPTDPGGSGGEWSLVASLRSVPRPEWDPLAGAGWSWDPAEGEGIRGWSVGLGLGLDPAIEEDPSSSSSSLVTRGWVGRGRQLLSCPDVRARPSTGFFGSIVPRFCEVAVAFRYALCSFPRLAHRLLCVHELAQPYYWAVAGTGKSPPPARHNNAMLCTMDLFSSNFFLAK